MTVKQKSETNNWTFYPLMIFDFDWSNQKEKKKKEKEK